MRRSVFVVAMALIAVLATAAYAEEIPFKTSVAVRLEGEITLDGFSDEWEDIMKWKADPMYTGDSFDVVPKSALWMAWDESNLYFFVRVVDGTISVPKPAEFWAVDTVELFIDGDNHKGEGYSKTDAQYWICPGGGGDDGTGVYVGQWHRDGDGIEATLYGAVPGVEAGLNVDDLGYTIEVVIPASALGLTGFSAGQKIGFNYTVYDLEFGGTFWATSKAVNTFQYPNLWGTVTLID